MSDTARHSKHECHEIAEDCSTPIHLYGGVDRNYILAFHFTTLGELKAFLIDRNGWSDEKFTALSRDRELSDGHEWAKLEVKMTCKSCLRATEKQGTTT